MEIDTDTLIVLSNLALVLVTGITIWLTVREANRRAADAAEEANRHAEALDATDAAEKHDLVTIVHEVLKAEKEEQEANFHAVAEEPAKAAAPAPVRRIS